MNTTDQLAPQGDYPVLDTDQTKQIRHRLEEMLAEIRFKGEETLHSAPDSLGPMPDLVDMASSEVSNTITFRLRDREYRLVKKIREALKRLDEGEYGICLECGDDISPARLLARPVTTLCLSCKQEQEKDEVLRERIRRPIE